MADTAPPVPVLPQGPYTPTQSPSPLNVSFGHRDASGSIIKSVSVPHHVKGPSGKWLFACRVVPQAKALKVGAPTMIRQGSLGRMEMAGTGQDGASEPHTVWRTWSEFVDFSTKLSAKFPTIPVDPKSSFSSTSSSTLPSSFYRQLPRLTKKITLYVSRATLRQRQEDLDDYVRTLFQLPDVIKKDILVRDFFRLRDGDVQTSPLSQLRHRDGSQSSVVSPTDDESDPYARYLFDGASPNATIRVGASKARARPALAPKRSTPDLRRHDSDMAIPDVPIIRRPLERVAKLDYDATVRNSKYSEYSISASSIDSAATITPASIARFPSPSPLAFERPSLHPFQFEGPTESSNPELTPKPAQRPRQMLRHFLSLQDLRRPSASSIHPPIPSPSVQPLARSQPQPLASSTSSAPPPAAPRMARTSSNSSNSSAGSRRPRSSSKSSSSSSFEDMGVASGTSYSHHSSSSSGGFRVGPSGRLDRIPDASHAYPGGRPSLPRTSSAATRATAGHGHSGHSPSPSLSSVTSSRSSAAGSSDMSRSFSSPDYRSRRSSTDYSESSYAPGTPPTPHMEEFSSKYFGNESGTLAQNNNVPLPPFFPVPPSMSSQAMMAAYSQDGMSHIPRPPLPSSRRPSYDSRSRGNSTSSIRPCLETIPSSPALSSTSSTFSSPQSRPQDRPTVTFKVLHPDANVALRLPRNGLCLDALRTAIDRKFAMSCALRLYGDKGDVQWALSYTTGRVGSDGVAQPELILNEADFQTALERTVQLEKMTLRIVS